MCVYGKIDSRKLLAYHYYYACDINYAVVTITMNKSECFLPATQERMSGCDHDNNDDDAHIYIYEHIYRRVNISIAIIQMTKWILKWGHEYDVDVDGKKHACLHDVMTCN